MYHERAIEHDSIFHQSEGEAQHSVRQSGSCWSKLRSLVLERLPLAEGWIRPWDQWFIRQIHSFECITKKIYQWIFVKLSSSLLEFVIVVGVFQAFFYFHQAVVLSVRVFRRPWCLSRIQSRRCRCRCRS